MHVFEDGSRCLSCKPGDRNLGRPSMAACKRTSGVTAVSGEKKMGWRVHRSQKAFAAWDYTRGRKIEEEGRKREEAEEAPSALLLTHVVIRSVAGTQRASPPPALVAVKALPRKAGASVVDGLRYHWPLGAEHHFCAERVEG
jgi:hypothetical protein